jgi:hypothetical protein
MLILVKLDVIINGFRNFALSMKIVNTFLTGLLFVCFALVFSSCDDEETYGDKKKKEHNTISNFIAAGTCVTEETTGDTLLYVAPITVISEEAFAAQDSMTNIANNEYVLLSKTGIYMQILRKGCGEKLKNGETATIFNRFIEFNIAGDSIQISNNNLHYIAVPDKMSCTNTYGNYTGSFISGIMRTTYATQSVPEGWLVPLQYINLGRIANPDDEIAKVRVIVPHSSGNSDAQSNVYACFYEITYERGR